MTPDQIAVVLAGALAGGLVNGLTGFGTGLTAMGLWLYVLSPTVAATLTILCSIVSQLQTLPMIWRAIRWKIVLPFVLPGLLGVPLGAWLLQSIDARAFRLSIGAFLIAYPIYALTRRERVATDWGGRTADGTAGFLSGILGGLAGFSGPLSVVWTDIRGWPREQRRAVLQAFNTSVLAFALVMHGLSGRFTGGFALAAAIAVPGSIVGALIGGFAYRRLGDLGYQRIVMLLLAVSGLTLVATSF